MKVGTGLSRRPETSHTQPMQLPSSRRLLAGQLRAGRRAFTPDKVLFVYPDTQRRRLGPNYAFDIRLPAARERAVE
jgi:hypothetical protein